ncbi:GNAT family N-acetyltransferase [Nonomuraea sp. NPDC005650]|uniref:GNAT family N-acetyltransferase n=1 Tax=Nonomuraea sp. NPDC005650 TaxID=3157045 RepID=UPI0033B38F71
MQVRPAVIEDARRVAEVHVWSWQTGYHGLLPQPFLDELRPSQRVPRWTRIIQQDAWPRQGTLVAEDVGEVVGFANFCPTRDDDHDYVEVGEITSIYVLPAAWRCGVGRQLMTAAMLALRSADFASATLWVLEGNVRAIRFYERLGWQPDGTVKDDAIGGIEIRELRYRWEFS